MWFEKLTGFTEESAHQVRSKIRLHGEWLVTDGERRLRHGRLTMPSLHELRAESAPLVSTHGRPELSVVEVVAEVRNLHRDTTNSDAVFQVASQFNLLQIPYPEVTPDDGVSAYEFDFTQGPACAISCGAGTLYRNYYALDGEPQTNSAQLDTLRDLGDALGNTNGSLWHMCNGYVLPSAASLETVRGTLSAASNAELERLRGLVRIGVHADTQVTIADDAHVVTQVLCAALPVAYAPYDVKPWEPFARLVLEAMYEATLCAAVINRERTGCNRVFLTLLGADAVGNDIVWITESMRKALHKYRSVPLQVFIVSYRSSNVEVRKLVQQFAVPPTS